MRKSKTKTPKRVRHVAECPPELAPWIWSANLVRSHGDALRLDSQIIAASFTAHEAWTNAVDKDAESRRQSRKFLQHLRKVGFSEELVKNLRSTIDSGLVWLDCLARFHELQWMEGILTSIAYRWLEPDDLEAASPGARNVWKIFRERFSSIPEWWKDGATDLGVCFTVDPSTESIRLHVPEFVRVLLSSQVGVDSLGICQSCRKIFWKPRRRSKVCSKTCADTVGAKIYYESHKNEINVRRRRAYKSKKEMAAGRIRRNEGGNI